MRISLLQILVPLLVIGHVGPAQGRAPQETGPDEPRSRLEEKGEYPSPSWSLLRAKEHRREKMNLPKPNLRGLSVEEAVLKRRSVRNYSGKPLSLAELSQLCFAAQGITGQSYGRALRAAPSAGALYPFEIYLVAGNVTALKNGIYHYSPDDHALTLLREGDLRSELARAALGQASVREAAVNFALVAVPERTWGRYGERSSRYIFMEAGHICQNIYLQATSLGLGSVVIGAFLDDEVNKIFALDGRKETVIALHPVGALP